MNLTKKAHELAADFIAKTDALCALDATMGNGHDTLFLSKTIGAGGMVFSFDIQGAALDSTRRLLQSEGVDEASYRLFEESHENFEKALGEASKEISCAFFNLGWLPGSDKKTITQAGSTLRALESVCKLFRERAGPGFLSVLSYRGHAGGSEEYAAVEKFFASLGARVEIYGGERGGASPVLFAAYFK